MTTTTQAPEVERSARRRGDAPTTATPVKPVTMKRRPWMVALAVALIALGGAGGAWLMTRSGESQEVLTITAPVARGEVIEATDLTTTELPLTALNLSTVSSSDLDAVVGQVATVDLLPGVLLSPEATAARLVPEAGASVVGVSLTDSQRPARPLSAGDMVRLVATPMTGGEAPTGEPTTFEATVINTQTSPSSGALILNVEVPSSQAPQLAALAATGRIALIIDPVE